MTLGQTYRVGDGVVCVNKRSVYAGKQGIVEEVEAPKEPYLPQRLLICYVAQGTVWHHSNYVAPIKSVELEKLQLKQDEFEKKRKLRGYY